MTTPASIAALAVRLLELCAEEFDCSWLFETKTAVRDFLATLTGSGVG